MVLHLPADRPSRLIHGDGVPRPLVLDDEDIATGCEVYGADELHFDLLYVIIADRRSTAGRGQR